MKHPYYGLRDSQGWLTRYPMDQVVWSRSEIKSYLSGGASFDSCSVWGCDPTKEAPVEWSGKLHILGRLIVAYGRYDWLPLYPGTFPIEDIDLTSYFCLCKGQVVKEYLESWGVVVNNSLFTLSKVSKTWLCKKIQKHCTREGVIYHLSCKSKRSYFFDHYSYAINRLDKSLNNKHFAYLLLCEYKYRARKVIMKRCGLKYNGDYRTVKTSRLVKVSTKYLSTDHTNRSLKIHYRSTFLYNSTSVGGLYVDGNNIYRYDENNTFIKAHRVGGLYVARVDNMLFIWNPELGFRDHVESSVFNGIKVAIKRYQSIRQASKTKSRITEIGVVTLREFKELTGSCFAGTMSFLNIHMPHIARLLEDFHGWHDALSSEVADVEWHLTEEAMDKIRHRF